MSICTNTLSQRSNIGNAKIAGMQTDLNLHGSQYNVALTVFFISYALLEVPCNIILKMMKPAHWIAIMMFAVRFAGSDFTFEPQLMRMLVGPCHDPDWSDQFLRGFGHC